MSRNCVTHFHACDCREEKFKKLEEENAELQAKIKQFAACIGDFHRLGKCHTTREAWVCAGKYIEKHATTIKEAEELLKNEVENE
jgi:hypothetical protein